MARLLERFRSGTLSLLQKLPVLPVITAGVVGLLQSLGMKRAPLRVFHEEVEVRKLLGLLWQVEAAAVALVLAASLFAFESLARQRSNIPLLEYAKKSWLAQFLMLAASGLLVIPIALFATPGLPAPSAGFAAALIGLGGLAALPLFFIQAINVVDPQWLRNVRLKEIRRTLSKLVDRDAFERVALDELQEWAKEFQVEVSDRMLLRDKRIIEESPTAGVILDLDLDRLEPVAQSHPGEVVVVTRLASNVGTGAALIACMQPTGSFHKRKAVTLSTTEGADDMDLLVRDLHEEGLESVRLGSPRAAHEVATMYAEVWLAWPRAWAKYDQKLQGGLIGGLEPFRVRPTDELKRNISTTMRQAVDRGLRDHVDAIRGILWKVGFEAVRLKATDLIDEMNMLARWFLTIESQSHPKLATDVIESACIFQIELCEYAARNFRDDSINIESAKFASEQVQQCFLSIVESLRSLFDAVHYDEFHDMDNRFQEILEYWDSEVPELHQIKRDLDNLRRGSRISLLGWMLRHGSEVRLSEDAVKLAMRLAGSLGNVNELLVAVGSVLTESYGLMSRWIMFDSKFEGGSVDTDGPVLAALALSLLNRQNVARIPPAPWMTAGRTERFVEIVGDIAKRSYFWDRKGETAIDVQDRAKKIIGLFSTANTEQKNLETLELIQKPLDATKVEAFKLAVAEGWRKNRVLLDFAALSGLDFRTVPSVDWTGDHFGFEPRLHSKGLFVTPTNWVGLDDFGADLGRLLSQGEVNNVIKLVVEHASEGKAMADATLALAGMLEELRNDGFEPSLIILPIDWRLARSLGLEDSGEYENQNSLRWNLKGQIETIPVIEWWEVPKDHIYAVDLHEFCHVTEGVESDGKSSPPAVAVAAIDDDFADRILATNGSLADQESDHDRKLRILTSVHTTILRAYRVELNNAKAARMILVSSPEVVNEMSDLIS